MPGSLFGILPANEPPTACIDSILPAKAYPGEVVIFEGHGSDIDGEVIAYQWWSSLDGELSTSTTFETSSLSQGTHNIWFRVQDDIGDWSEKTFMQIAVFPSGVVQPPVINFFNASPGSIFEGGSATLSWEVTDATTVTVEPGIGGVALAGTRLVVPTATSKYTLTATNRGGSISTEAEVIVVSRGQHSVTLFSVVSEGGHVRKDGAVGTEPNVGHISSGVAMQAFLSFDISAIPAGASIKSASLDLRPVSVSGDPFNFLGEMGVFSDQYGDLESDDFVAPPLMPRIRFTIYTERFPMTEALRTFYFPPDGLFSSSALTSAIQKRVNAGSPRFQIRLQFEKYSCYDREADYIELGEGISALVIQYED